MSRRPLYVFGGGGHGKVVAEAALQRGDVEVRGFLDDDAGKHGTRLFDRVIVGDLDAWSRLESDAVLALGVGSNRVRLDLLRRTAERAIALMTVVHPSATVSSGVSLGSGVYVGPRAVIHVDARIGSACIVNSGAVVEHDCSLADGVHVSPGAVLGGEVRLGVGVHVGLGAAVLPGVCIGAWTVIGAGSVVTRPLPENVIAWGSPARVRRPVDAPQREDP